MIIGIGTDIIEIERIRNAVKNTPKFTEKIFTKAEIELFRQRNMKSETIAGNFAAKEAISKAIGTGVRGFSLDELEILRDDLGKPIVNISDNIRKLINSNSFIINVSISHNKNSAIAFAIIEEKL